MEQGVDRAKYSVVPRNLIFVFHGGNVLLLQGARDKRLWAGLYNGVGGHLDPGEDAQSAAVRELHEETGISCASLHLAGVIHVNTGEDIGVLITVYRADVRDAQVVSSREGDLHWIPVEKIQDYPLVSDLYQLIPRVAVWKHGDVVFSGLSQKVGDRWVIQFSD